jgi:peptidoglycan hydrolase CwlO-like protein
MGQEQDVNDLMRMKDELTKERDKLLNDITQIRRDLDDSSFKQNELERQIHESNEQIVTLQEKIAQAKTENMREAKKRVKLMDRSIFVRIRRFSSRSKSNWN